MEKAAEPRPVATKRRLIRPRPTRRFHSATKSGCAASSVRDGSRASWRHMATQLSTRVTTAAPCTTWMRRIALKSANSHPNSSALIIMPTRSMT